MSLRGKFAFALQLSNEGGILLESIRHTAKEVRGYRDEHWMDNPEWYPDMRVMKIIIMPFLRMVRSPAQIPVERKRLANFWRLCDKCTIPQISGYITG